MSWIAANPKSVGFHQLPDDVQDRIVRCLQDGRVPDVTGYDISNDMLGAWLVNRRGFPDDRV